MDEGANGPWIDFHKPNRHTKFMSDRSVFPLRSLIPVKMDGLLGAQGNVGFSSIVSAAIRLHDQRIQIGQAAGATAAVALQTKVQPRAIPYDRAKLEAIRDALCGEHEGAIPALIWPFRDLPADHIDFVPINRLAALGVLPIGSREVDFRPDDPAEKSWMQEVLKRSGVGEGSPIKAGNRGDYCQKVWRKIQAQGWAKFKVERKSEKDADGDGILDRDDALLFTPNEPIVFKIEKTELSQKTDGLSEWAGQSKSSLSFYNFGGVEDQAAKGGYVDTGRTFTDKRGFGWSRDLSENHRSRGKMKGARDNFIFTRDEDVWECALENGRYRVTACIGDSGHVQAGQNLAIEGKIVAIDAATASGEFRELTQSVEVKDGRLTLKLGKPDGGSNTAINWLLIENVR